MLSVEWTKHLKDDASKVRLQNEILSAKPVLERLAQLLSEKERDLDRSENSLAAYDNPNWAYRQAHKNGYRTCLDSLKKLITT